MTAPSSDLIELHRLFEFVRPVFCHRAYAFGCLHLPDRPEHSVKAAIGVSVLDPQALRRQQRLTLSGVDPGLQRLVGCIQSLIRHVGFCLYAFDDSGCRGFIAARLEARPKHLGFSRECSRHGQHRDRKEYLSLTSIPPVRFTRALALDVSNHGEPAQSREAGVGVTEENRPHSASSSCPRPWYFNAGSQVHSAKVSELPDVYFGEFAVGVSPDRLVP